MTLNDGIPLESDLPPRIFVDDEVAYNYFLMKGVIKVPVCPLGHGPMRPRKNRDQKLGYYQCSCRKGRSALTNTFLVENKVRFSVLMKIIYLWITKCKVESVDLLVPSAHTTVVDWYQYLREIVMLDLLHLSGEEGKMGGIGPDGQPVVVEIDETKLGVRKFNMGHRVEGVWVVGLRERGPKGRFICLPVPNRKKSTLMPLIKKYVRPHSQVNSDMWKGYCTKTMESWEMTHKTVNHSKGFKAPDGTHTNTIEGMWAAVKARVPYRARTESRVATYLMLFNWRRRFQGKLWDQLFSAMSRYEELRTALPAPEPEEDADVVFDDDDDLDGEPDVPALGVLDIANAVEVALTACVIC
jgi:transposase-like protein